MINVILCGGAGTRLWPVSRKYYPKQFCKFLGKYSLFQQTLLRNLKISQKIIVVTNDAHYFIAKDQVEELKLKDLKISYILETVAKNTAPAIAAACFIESEGNAPFLITPADHFIEDKTQYYKLAQNASDYAQEGEIITFGIKADKAETGYGYIEVEKDVKVTNLFYKVKKFKEKPDKETADKYIKNGNYFWNAGIFIFDKNVFLAELKKFRSDIYNKTASACENVQKVNSNTYRLKKELFELIPSQSVDYAVMEKTHRISTFKADIGWDDLGTFDALSAYLPADKNNNTSDDNIICVDSENNMILNQHKNISMLDVQDLIVVNTSDALLITKKNKSENVRKIHEILKKTENSLTDFHTTIHRPWGKYTVLEQGYRYKIKNITVRVGKSLSLQKHYHRSEHWVVVNGTAEVELEYKNFMLNSGESVYVGAGKLHRLANNGKIPLVIIEVSVGDYLREDDIERFEDEYGRK
ncbi:MAG: mannose-1-phosphate guanylyltransferase/mannose-6-phosphate isomerase [Candidatus Muiribacteriota bacterium]